MKIECKSCKNMIDDDSAFCKYCGKKIVGQQDSKAKNEKLISIFNGVKETLCNNSQFTEVEFSDRFDKYKSYKNKKMSNNEYYQLLVNIIFYSGFKAATVDIYLEKIHEYFADYNEVMKYNDEQIEIIKNNPKMIQNKKKIEACVKNAKKINEIVNEYGSVEKYVLSFKANLNDDCLFKLKKSLEKNFSFIGGITSYHFMTDIGLNVLKPDRVILRIFSRLGLIENDKDLFGAVKVGRAFSIATKLPIRYIDIIFVMYGQLNQKKIECICSERKPKCFKCAVKDYCKYMK